MVPAPTPSGSSNAARERLGDRAEFRRADLDEPLEFDDAAFDVVLSALALNYVADWSHALGEFRRVLRPGGVLVCSVHHPFADHLRLGGDYFAIEPVSEVWTGFGEPVEVPAYRRPLAAVLDPVVDAGFALERVVEPTPVPAFAEHDPAAYEELSAQPSFLCLRARTPAP